MYMFARHNTERGIRLRNSIVREIKAKTRLQLQREIYEAKIEEAQHIAAIRQAAAESALAMALEMKAQGLAFHHSFREIERRACKLFNVTTKDIRSNRRHRDIVLVRHFIMYWAARLTNLSTPQIGRLMGGKDHTTVIHGKRKYVERRRLMGRNIPVAR